MEFRKFSDTLKYCFALMVWLLRLESFKVETLVFILGNKLQIKHSKIDINNDIHIFMMMLGDEDLVYNLSVVGDDS